MIVVSKQGAEVMEEKEKLVAFRKRYFPKDKDRTHSIYIGKTAKDRYPIYVVRRFGGKSEAMKFHQKLKEKGKKYMPKSCRVFYAISQNNYRTILKNRSIDGYQKFFQENYLHEN